MSELAADTIDTECLTVQNFGQLTQQLMYLNRHHEASRMMSLGTELFPDSAPAHAKLGDAWHAKGEKEEAMKSWAQALMLDPTHEGALRRIKNIDF